MRKLIFFLLGIRECFYCHGICGDWRLKDNTYPHADATDYVYVCIRCYNTARNLPVGEN
jgi:hypothetical protein